MCPGSPDRGRNACVQGPSVVTEVDGLLCPSVSHFLSSVRRCQNYLLTQKMDPDDAE